MTTFLVPCILRIFKHDWIVKNADISTLYAHQYFDFGLNNEEKNVLPNKRAVTIFKEKL